LSFEIVDFQVSLVNIFEYFKFKEKFNGVSSLTKNGMEEETLVSISHSNQPIKKDTKAFLAMARRWRRSGLPNQCIPSNLCLHR